MAAALKTMTTHRLVVLLVVFLFGNSFHLLADDPADWTDLYLPVALLSGSLLLTTFTAATILLYVRLVASSVEAKAAAACKQGVAYKISPAWWNRVRALHLLAIGLSAASSMLAVFTFEFGFQYRQGRVSGIFGWPACLLVTIMGLEHTASTFGCRRPWPRANWR